MDVLHTTIPGCLVINIEPIHDRRGFFARLYSRDEFRSLGIESDIVQTNWSSNTRRGTIRGMHYQAAPFEEIKIVQCLRGAVRDVVLDLRRGSATFGQWAHFMLNSAKPQMVVVPQGCAHGFETLEDDSELLYHVTAPYSPTHARGVRWNDPKFKINWMIADPILSDRDQSFPDFAD